MANFCLGQAGEMLTHSVSVSLLGLPPEILTGAFNHQMSSGLIRDYPENSTSFADASCTALLSATAYRMSSLKLSSQWIVRRRTPCLHT